MSPFFRFMVLCHGATQRQDRTVDLLNIVSDLKGSSSEPTELIIAVGLVLLPDMGEKTMALMGWTIDTQRTKQPGYSCPLPIPRDVGPSVEAYSINLPTPHSGSYGFDLFDADGAFGAQGSLLATYRFEVIVR
jgi:hypothetical protein